MILCRRIPRALLFLTPAGVLKRTRHPPAQWRTPLLGRSDQDDGAAAVAPSSIPSIKHNERMNLHRSSLWLQFVFFTPPGPNERARRRHLRGFFVPLALVYSSRTGFFQLLPAVL